MDVLDTLQISASGLTAERVRLQAIASNLANARTTRTEGNVAPYQRRVPVFESVDPQGSFASAFQGQLQEVSIKEIRVDPSEGRAVYDPGHPDADALGYVRYPDIDVLREMVDLMSSSRAYEANLNALDTTRQMAMRALEIGR